ncbi:MAG: hypothetical protein NTU43_12560 [Bacteroidetes bacterium]|nr:hypothetical protein [Bacteroidota bacterium]
MNIPIIIALLLTVIVLVYIVLPKLKLNQSQSIWLKTGLSSMALLFLAYDFWSKQKDMKIVVFFVAAALLFLLIGYKNTRTK